MEKRFLTHSEQIDYLIKKKNLTVSNREYAEEMLCRIGYFGLICGYKAPYKDTRTGKYLDGTTFEDIVALYKFDENKTGNILFCTSSSIVRRKIHFSPVHATDF